MDRYNDGYSNNVAAMVDTAAAAAAHDVGKEWTPQSSCYIQLFNLDLQPCFVELNSGRPSWLMESIEELLHQVKYLTHFVNTSAVSETTIAGLLR